MIRKWSIIMAVLLLLLSVIICILVFLVKPHSDLYPLNMNPTYAAAALDPPEILWETTAEMNGMAGLIFTFNGEVLNIETYSDESGFYDYEDAHVKTEYGMVTVTNLYKSIYYGNLKKIGKPESDSIFVEPVENFILPEEGTKCQFICTYMGYSNKTHQPVFVLGASPAIYTFMGIEDPIAEVIESNK